jgi:hypothetical protein
MALTKREQVLIERFKRSGRAVDQKKLDAPFSILVRPLSAAGLDTGKFALWFENEMSNEFVSSDLKFPIKRIMISPHVLDETMAKRPADRVTFKRRENAVFVGLGIDYSRWRHASDKSKLTEMYENIKESILKIPQNYLGDGGREALLVIVEKAFVQLKSRLKH